ncbi:hypothetical protein KI387_009544 [Taxus chinensis]|uniref:AB hydrolase-1 domain-containing protein n=1 Tax=Taxus chinensis TaxID=29808 RepID=A0AA38FJL2_TAXCH|nr:hypothetical protein KI387_009544 [Taxus chinensis]
MVNYLNALLYGVGGIVCTCMVLLVTFQEKLVYVPVIPGMTKGYPITPARLRLTYEDVWLTSADGIRLHAWFIKHIPECTGPTMLFFQENAGNIAHRLEFIRILVQKLKCNVFMLSYRGYGASDGFPSQDGISHDAQAALEHLLQRTDIDTSKIVVFGRSLGGAVGAVLAKNNPEKISALMLENTFTSVLDMAGVLLPPLKWFIGGSDSKGPRILNRLVRSPWNTIDIIDQIKQPILYISGSRDEMVPPSHMHRLFEKTKHNPRCTFEEFAEGTHMDTWYVGGERYWQALQRFLEKELSSSEENKELSRQSWEKDWED